MKKTAVAVISDLNYIDYASFLVFQIRKFDPNLNPFYVITDGIDSATFSHKFKEFEATQIPIDMAQIENLGVIPQGHVTVSSYAKIMIAEILPKDVNHVIYLDVDILPVRSIQPLIDFPIHSSIAATQFANGESRILFGTDDATYFSAGMLKLDLDKWRKEGYSNKLIQLLSNNPRLHYGEQDLLNLFFKENWQLLPTSFNFMAEISLNANLWDRDISPMLVHLVGSRKPWTVRGHTKWHDLWRQEYIEFSRNRDVRKLILSNSDSFLYRTIMKIFRLQALRVFRAITPKGVKTWAHIFGEK